MLVSLPTGRQFEQPPPYPPPQAGEGNARGPPPQAGEGNAKGPPPRAGEGKVSRSLALAFADRDGDVFALAGADHAEPVRRADLEGAQLAEELIQVPHRVAVNGHDRVALQEAGRLGRTTRLNRDDQQPTLLSHLLCQRLAQPDGLGAETEIGAPDPAVRPQALGHPVGGLQRNRAADTAGEVPAVDADDAALSADNRAP